MMETAQERTIDSILTDIRERTTRYAQQRGEELQQLRRYLPQQNQRRLGDLPQYIQDITRFVSSIDGIYQEKVRGQHTLQFARVRLRVPHVFRHTEERTCSIDDVVTILTESERKNEDMTARVRRALASYHEIWQEFMQEKDHVESQLLTSLQKSHEALESMTKYRDEYNRLVVEQKQHVTGSVRYEEVEARKEQLLLQIIQEKYQFDEHQSSYTRFKTRATHLQKEMRGILAVTHTLHTYGDQLEYVAKTLEMLKIIVQKHTDMAAVTEAYTTHKQQSDEMIQKGTDLSDTLKYLGLDDNERKAQEQQEDLVAHLVDDIRRRDSLV